MAIRVTCSCGKVLQGRNEDAGRQAKCPACGNLLTLPAADEVSLPTPSSRQDVPPEENVRRSSGKTYRCSVCSGSFRSAEVYDDNGTIICKRCHESTTDQPRRDDSRQGARRAARERRPERERLGEAEDIPSNLVWAILATLFCCQPLGIVAIVFAASVSDKVKNGDYEGARSASRTALICSLIAAGLVGIPLLCFMAVMMLGLIAGAAGR